MGCRENIFGAIREIVADVDPAAPALDFGCGDGWFTQAFKNIGFRDITPVDVKRRRKALVVPIIYDGQQLPFDRHQFSFAFSIDVFHHCAQPESSIREVLRCTRDYFLLKDHVYSNRRQWLTLCVLDEIGNRRFGIPSIYRYQYKWSWSKVIESEGFVLRHLTHPLRVHQSLLGRATNALQFAALWQRSR